MGAGSRLVRRRLEVGFLLLAIGSVVGTVQHWSQARDDRAFDQRGKAARALPETHLPASTRVGDEIALSYVAPDDKVVVAKPLKLNQERLDILRGGGRLDIVYLPDSPRTIRYAGWEPDFVPLWTFPLFAFVGLASFVEGFQKSRDDRAFDLYGRHAMTRPAENVVQDTRQGVGKAQGVSGAYWYADFTFKTDDGQEVTLTHLPLAPSQVDPVVGGRPMDIVYLPRHPTTVRWPGWEPQSSQTTWGSLLLFLAAGAGFWFLRKTAR